MTNIQWSGVMPALMTELKQDGSLDMAATAKHLEACLAAGCNGIIVLGTLGENSSMSPEEKELIARTAVKAADGRVPVIAGIGEYTSGLAISTVKRLERAGVDGFMVLPSMVYQQDTREAIAHFAAIAKSTRLPMMIYNNPVGYKVDLSPADFMQLAVYDNIIAVKESSHDSRRMTDMINVCGDRFLLFCGVDDLAFENLLLGAVGWVSGMTNAFPHETVRLYNLLQEGRLDEARSLYRWMMPILHLDVDVKLVQYIKLANQMAGMGSEWVRSPRLPLVGAERARIEAILRDVINNRPALAA